MRLVLPALLAVVLCTCGTPVTEPVTERVAEHDLRSAFAASDHEAIQTLIRRMAREAPRYEEMLVANLADADRGVREWSAHAIGDLGLFGEATIDALMKAFEDEDDWVRWKAARALGLIGPPARRALPLLEATANAERASEIGRASAQVAVRRIRGQE